MRVNTDVISRSACLMASEASFSVQRTDRTGIRGDSKPWKGWGHGVHVRVEAPVVEAVSG